MLLQRVRLSPLPPQCVEKFADKHLGQSSVSANSCITVVNDVWGESRGNLEMTNPILYKYWSASFAKRLPLGKGMFVSIPARHHMELKQ